MLHIQMSAFQIMIEEFKKSLNTAGYKAYVSHLVPLLGIDYQLDQPWFTKKEKDAFYQYERLDKELNAAKSNVNKNAIRVCFFPYFFVENLWPSIRVGNRTIEKKCVSLVLKSPRIVSRRVILEWVIIIWIVVNMLVL
jgi:hypothetical protein